MFGQGAIGQFALGQFLTIGATSLTGVAATCFAGSITPQETLNLTGVFATGAAGTPAGAPSPIGVSAIATAAAIAPTPQDSKSLTSAVATGAAGAVQSAGAPAGVFATGQAGTLVPALLKAVVGVFATGAAAPFAITEQIPLLGAFAVPAAGLINLGQVEAFGVFATGVAGNVTVTGTVSTNLTGVSASGAVGAFAIAESVAFVGAAATGAPGAIASGPSSLVGTFATAAQGTISIREDLTFGAVIASAIAGQVFESVSVFLIAQGAAANGMPGQIILPRFLPGVFAVGFAGTIIARTSQSLTQIACTIYGRGVAPVVQGRAAYAIVFGRDCGCEMAKFHPPEYFEQGDTWQIKGILSYGDGTPFNLGAGCSIQWGLQNSAGQLALDLSLNSGITVLDAANGICLITVTPVQSEAIAVGQYTDQLQATDPTGLVSTQWKGPVNVEAAFFT